MHNIVYWKYKFLSYSQWIGLVNENCWPGVFLEVFTKFFLHFRWISYPLSVGVLPLPTRPLCHHSWGVSVAAWGGLRPVSLCGGLSVIMSRTVNILYPRLCRLFFFFLFIFLALLPPSVISMWIRKVFLYCRGIWHQALIWGGIFSKRFACIFPVSFRVILFKINLIYIYSMCVCVGKWKRPN